MATLSVVLIVKNEGANLAACLDTVSWVDEIVVVDAGSSDNTVEIAQRYTSKVHVENDWQGYGVQRQRAQRYATGDWILMLDADERVTPELRTSIEQAVANDDRKAVYAVPRLSWCFGRFIRHGGWYPDRVVRLYPREHASYGEERVHEKLHFGSLEVRKINGDLLHFTYRDLHHYLVKSAGYARDWSMQRHARGRKASLLEGAWHGLGCFLRMYLLRAGFLDGRAGLLLALLSAHSTFVKYADLWLRDQPSAPDNAS
jgi:(heptosyl)LPS beta-1,4-glucosyltransferase